MAIEDFFTAGRTTKLSAVNTMLASVGREPVTALDPSQDALADIALVALNEVDLMVQTQGMEENREEDWPIPLNVDGEAEVPENVLRIDAARCAYYPADKKALTQRGSRIYNRRDRTFVLTPIAPIKVDCIVRLAFEDLPQAARMYIAVKAAQLFQGRQQTSTVIDRVEQRQVDTALVIWEQHVDDTNDHNQIDGNPSVSKALARGQAFRR